MKTAVDKVGRGKQRAVNKRFTAMVSHYLFEAEFCNPASGTHLDYSARLQSVSNKDKPDYHAVISEFAKLTDCAVLVNTSFNVRGEPIICTPEDAYRCFMRTEMDILVIEDFLLFKEEQPPWEEEGDWRLELELD